MSRTPKDPLAPLLTCYGCAHAAASAEWPGHPSGETPCIVCERNTRQAEDYRDVCGRSASFAKRFEGLLDRIPADMYIALDRSLYHRAIETRMDEEHRKTAQCLDTASQSA